MRALLPRGELTRKSRSSGLSLLSGTSTEKPWRFAIASTTLPYHESVIVIRCHGSSAPSEIDRLRLITRSGSNSMRTPRPVQTGHAPCGELNENERGSSSSIVYPSNGQLYFSL